MNNKFYAKRERVKCYVIRERLNVTSEQYCLSVLLNVFPEHLWTVQVGHCIALTGMLFQRVYKLFLRGFDY